MKKVFSKKVQGFTLIELIIVIAILGILAVAVLSAINPLEQIRKANDSRRKSNAAELLNGAERYISSYAGEYPAEFAAIGSDSPGALVTAAMVNGLGAELKSEYATRISKTSGTDNVYVYTDNAGLLHACYQVESEEQQSKYSSGIVSSGGNYLTCLPE